MAQDCLTIGLDFGTTFTGISIVYGSNADDIEVIKTWPGGNGVTCDKVPTEFCYDSMDWDEEPEASNKHKIPNPFKFFSSPLPPLEEAQRELKDVRWGFQLKPGDDRIRCIKLFLDRHQKMSDFVSEFKTMKQLEHNNRRVIDAVADYLAQVYQHTLVTLNKRYGDTVIKDAKIQFVVTVPAVWSDAAKDATLAAAVQAGMGNEIKMISEPEAAACYTLKAIQPNHLRVGDIMVVCDAGGGTVDLISYRIKELFPLKLTECQTGTGGLCGAAFLNIRFSELVKSRIGEAEFKEMVEKKPKTWSTAMKYFEEYVKRNVNEEALEEFNIPFPGLPDDEKAGIDSGFMALTSEEVLEIFEPVVKQVIELIDGQVSSIAKRMERVSAILLVGGFGQSAYLFARVKAHFGGNPPPYTEAPASEPTTKPNGLVKVEGGKLIQVMQPPNAWTAVARGAAIRGLEGTVVAERRCRYNYGVRACLWYDGRYHPASSRYWDHLKERWMASNAMSWYVKKGELVPDKHKVVLGFSRSFEGGYFPSAESLIIRDELSANNEEVAPIMYARSTTFTVCTLVTDLSTISRTHFAKRTNSKGYGYWRIHYDLEMRINSASLEFELRVGGRGYGAVKAVFNK